jgi:hypothetical protein
MERPRVKDLVAAVGISKTYASDILAGKQPPSRALAIGMFRATGWKHDAIASLTDEQIDVLESVEPWKPVQDRAA